jgi:hypothetical protein
LSNEGIIFSASNWKNNAYLISDCAKLGYLAKEKKTLDPTYCRGKWWTVWKPDNLVYHDKGIDGVDFTNLPYSDEEFDQICFDPPYVCVGGKKSRMKGIEEMYQNFGLIEGPSTPKAVQQLINDGITECYRVLKKKGTLLVKCQDYTTGGKFILGTYWTIDHALKTGLVMRDRMEHLGTARPQPHKIQKTSRRNLSTLLVFTKK